MRVESFPEMSTPLRWRRQVVALQELAWPSAPGSPPPGPGPTHDAALAPLSVLLLDGDTVVAALDVLAAPLPHAGRSWQARGLSTVVVHPSGRGRGLGLELVRAAARGIEASGADLTLFTCDRPLRRFYESAGYEVLAGAVVVGGTPTDPLRSDAPGFDKVTLAALHSPAAVAARPAFLGVDLALYPGPVDRLW